MDTKLNPGGWLMHAMSDRLKILPGKMNFMTQCSKSESGIANGAGYPNVIPNFCP
nr:hypothetical protein [Polynucleobacter necessarius]